MILLEVTYSFICDWTGLFLVVHDLFLVFYDCKLYLWCFFVFL